MKQTTSKWTRETWPIAAAMIQYPNILPDGSSVQDQSAEDWACTLSDVADAGFTELDPTDSWLRLADLSPARLAEFMTVAKSLGLTIPAISTSRRSVIDAQRGDEYLAYGHRVIDTAKEIGAGSVSFGLFEPLTNAQKQALWVWTVDGAEELGIELSLEMYEDTYLGTADNSVRFVEEVGLDNVGINADLGNLIRLHRPVEHWQQMMEKVAPYAKYWHVKNYTRTEDPASGVIVTHPAPLESGIINYRAAIGMALDHGFASPFLCEHYGGDGLSVSATNRDYLRRILPRG